MLDRLKQLCNWIIEILLLILIGCVIVPPFMLVTFGWFAVLSVLYIVFIPLSLLEAFIMGIVWLFTGISWRVYTFRPIEYWMNLTTCIY